MSLQSKVQQTRVVLKQVLREYGPRRSAVAWTAGKDSTVALWLWRSLLLEMEQAMPGLGISTLYTIARACSHGMNITFARCGYTYGGMLVNNTQISGAIESMNVWYKRLPAT